MNQSWFIYKWTPGNKFQWNLDRNYTIFIQENSFENVFCQNGGHFVQGEMSYNLKFSMARVNSLGPSDDIWRQRSGSTLAQVMACCLTAPSHYLNQCWLISNVEWHSSEGSSQEIPQSSITEIIWKIKDQKFHSNFPGANELTNCSGM